MSNIEEVHFDLALNPRKMVAAVYSDGAVTAPMSALRLTREYGRDRTSDGKSVPGTGKRTHSVAWTSGATDRVGYAVSTLEDVTADDLAAIEDGTAPLAETREAIASVLSFAVPRADVDYIALALGEGTAGPWSFGTRGQAGGVCAIDLAEHRVTESGRESRRAVVPVWSPIGSTYLLTATLSLPTGDGAPRVRVTIRPTLSLPTGRVTAERIA